MFSALTETELKLVMGASTFLGFAGLVVYLYFKIVIPQTGSSVSGDLFGQPVLNRPETWAFLSGFKDEKNRIMALKTLKGFADVDNNTAKDILERMGTINANRAQEASLNHRRTAAILAMLFFWGVAGLAFFDKTRQPVPPSPASEQGAPSKGLPAGSIGTPASALGVPSTPKQLSAAMPATHSAAPNSRYAGFYAKAAHDFDAGDIKGALKACALAKDDPAYSDNPICKTASDHEKLWGKEE